MAKFRNTSGNDLFIPAVNKLVVDDGVFEVPEADAAGFECQPSNYTRVDESKKSAKAEKEDIK